MIPILYSRDERAFTSQGICRLYETVSCVVTEEKNGIYECEFQYPIEGEHFSDIIEGAYIGATHDDQEDIQPFEIYGRSAPINGVVTFYAHHLSYKLNSCILAPHYASSVNEALNLFPGRSMTPCPFTFETKMGTIEDFYVTKPISIREALLGEENSILSVYGPGEFEYDIWNVKFHEHRGKDNGVEIRYGKNMTDITHEYDQSEVYTAVVPYWYKEDDEGHITVVIPNDYNAVINTEASTHSEKWTNESDKVITTKSGEPIEFSVDNTIYTPLDLSSEFEEEPTVEELVERARELFEAAKPWEPKDNIKVSFVSLWQTEEYKDIAPLEKVSLCDTVKVIYTNLGVETTTEVIKTVYNTLLDRYDSIELGDTKANLAGEIRQQLDGPIGDLEQEIGKRPTSEYLEKQFEIATQLIQGGLGGYIVMTPNADGQPQEILVLDHPALEDAINVIRINKNGIGFSNNGYLGPFNSAWTIDGTFDAQYINVINLTANVLRTGLLTDSYGYNFWNLDTGEFALSDATVVNHNYYVEETKVVSREAGYEIGDYIKVGNETYKAITKIKKGDTLTIGNNVEAANSKTLLDFIDRSEAITEVDVEYTSHNSGNNAPGPDAVWSTTAPQWEQGKFIWQRTKTVDGNGKATYSDPTCIQGAKGAEGAKTAIIYLYRRQSMSVAPPTINWNYGITYNFDTNSLETSVKVPSGKTLYNENDFIATGSYNYDDYIKIQNDIYVVININGIGPTNPIVYEGNNANVTLLQPAPPVGWSLTIPDGEQDGTEALYVTAATASGVDSTDVIEASEWAAPVALVKDGRDGLTATAYRLLPSHDVITLSDDEGFNPEKFTLTAKVKEGSLAEKNYAGRFVVEKTVDNSTWETVYTSSSNESSKTIYVNPMAEISIVQGGIYSSTGKNFDGSYRVRSGDFVYLEPGTYTLNYNYKGNNDKRYSVVFYSSKSISSFVSYNGFNLVGKSFTVTNAIYARFVFAVLPDNQVAITPNDISNIRLIKDGDAESLAYRCSLYKAGNTSGADNLLDQQTIPVAFASRSGYTIILTNENHTFAGTATGALPSSAVCHVKAYKGTTPIEVTINDFNNNELPEQGLSVEIDQNTNGTLDAKFTVTATATMTTRNGSLTVSVTTADGKTFQKIFSYSLALNGSDGFNSATVFLYARAESLDALKNNLALSQAGGHEGCPKVNCRYWFNLGRITKLDSAEYPFGDTPWVPVMPEDNGYPCFVIQATAASFDKKINGEPYDDIGFEEWSAPRELVSSKNNRKIKSIDRFYAVNTYYLLKHNANGSLPKANGKYSTIGTRFKIDEEYYQSILAIAKGDQLTVGYNIKQVASIAPTSYAKYSGSGWPAKWGLVTVGDNTKYSKTTLWGYEQINYVSGSPGKTAPIEVYYRVNANDAVTSVEKYYLASHLDHGITWLPQHGGSTSGWSTSFVTPDEISRFLWTYEAITHEVSTTAKPSPFYTKPRIITQFSVGIANIVEEYYLSTSKDKQIGGYWSVDPPSWQSGKYLWTRSHIFYDNGSSSYSTPVLADYVSELDQSLNQQEVFNRLTNHGQNEGLYLEDGHVYINGSYIATGIIADKRENNQNFWDLEKGLLRTTFGEIAGFYLEDNKLLYSSNSTPTSIGAWKINVPDMDTLMTPGKNRLVSKTVDQLKDLNPSSSDGTTWWWDTYVGGYGTPSGAYVDNPNKENAAQCASGYCANNVLIGIRIAGERYYVDPDQNGNPVKRAEWYKARGVYNYVLNTLSDDATWTGTKKDLLFLLDDSFSFDASDDDYYLTGCPPEKGCSIRICSSTGKTLYQCPSTSSAPNRIRKNTKLSNCKIYLSILKSRTISPWVDNGTVKTGIVIFPMLAKRTGTNDDVYEPYITIPIQAVEISPERISVAGDIASLLGIDESKPFWGSRASLVRGGLTFDLINGNDSNATWRQTGFLSSWAKGIMCKTNNFIVDGTLVTWGGQSAAVNTTSYGTRAVSNSLSVESYISDCGSGQLSTDSMAIPEYIPIGDIYYNPNKIYFYYNETANAFLLEEEDLTNEATFSRLRNSLFEFNTNHYAISGIAFDSIFMQLIDNANANYHVFLQKYGPGDCYPAKRESGGFRVIGTPGLSFAWEVKAKKKSASQNGELVPNSSGNNDGSYGYDDRYPEIDLYNPYPYIN